MLVLYLWELLLSFSTETKNSDSNVLLKTFQIKTNLPTRIVALSAIANFVSWVYSDDVYINILLFSYKTDSLLKKIV